MEKRGECSVMEMNSHDTASSPIAEGVIEEEHHHKRLFYEQPIILLY
jgi:hypothetical protein